MFNAETYFSLIYYYCTLSDGHHIHQCISFVWVMNPACTQILAFCQFHTAAFTRGEESIISQTHLTEWGTAAFLSVGNHFRRKTTAWGTNN
jgi:hypothetical protein